MNILQFVVVCYAIFCLGFVINKIRHNIKYVKKAKDSTMSNAELLEYMDDHHAPAEYADAFVRLVKQGYVLLHTMGNTGNKYDDQLQVKRYSENFTTEVAQGIKSLKGKYV